LADEAYEDAFQDIAASRQISKIDPGWGPVPDAIALLNFRHLLEKHKVGNQSETTQGHTVQPK
jgi:IS5 family transposase